MRANTVKRKLQQGHIAWGTWITTGNVHVTRALSMLGFDWLTVDMEHAPVDWSTVANLVGVIADAGVVPFVRVPEGTDFYIKRALDLGAFGVVVPMVESLEQARRVVSAARYPPEGHRSAGGGLHHLHFGATLAEYLARANQEIMIILQIESPQGVEVSASIAAEVRCDSLFIGPLDLQTRLAATAGNDLPSLFDESVARVFHAARTHGVAPGFHARTVSEARFWARKGALLLGVGTDIGFLTEQAQNSLASLKEQSMTNL